MRDDAGLLWWKYVQQVSGLNQNQLHLSSSEVKVVLNERPSSMADCQLDPGADGICTTFASCSKGLGFGLVSASERRSVLVRSIDATAYDATHTSYAWWMPIL